MSYRNRYRFTALCDGISSGSVDIELSTGIDSWIHAELPPSGEGIFSSAIWTFQLRLNSIQYQEGTDTGRIITANSMLIDSNGLIVGSAPWYAWADHVWPTDAPIGVLHYPQRLMLTEDDAFRHAFSLITHRTPHA